MRIFGLWITTDETYKEYRYLKIKQIKFRDVTTWFNGWPDLKIIWNYVQEDTNFGGIAEARREYARLRETSVHGEKIK